MWSCSRRRAVSNASRTATYRSSCAWFSLGSRFTTIVPPGTAEIDADVVDLAMAVVSVIGAQRHPAGGHSIPKLLEFLNPAPHLGLDGRRRFHATEGDLDVGWHVYSSWVALPYHSAAAAAGFDLDQCRAASFPGRIQLRSC